MRSRSSFLAVAAAAGLVAASPAHAHATYNIEGYDAGKAGSTNGADGLPALPGEWTNGPVSDYTGSLPVNWYAGMHGITQVRTIQTGAATNPPAGSLLQQITSYNAANDPDLPTDRVLAVGGLSWSDPGNGDQGWGHGLDYGLLHFSPIETYLTDGPVVFTVTVADDPSDGDLTRLAFAVYGGWDSSATSSRHQTFVTQPTPVDSPLGATGLVYLGSAVASSAGNTVSLTLPLDATYGGEYTVLVGALGGTAGQYQVTFSTGRNTEALALLEELADEDEDGVLDASDACPETLSGEEVDAEGCSQAAFCASFDATTKEGANACKNADWGNDEPVMTLSRKAGEIDCIVDKGGKGSADDLCVVPAQ